MWMMIWVLLFLEINKMKYAIKMDDGSVSIMVLISAEAAVENEIAKWPADVQAKVVSYRVIEDDKIPADRSFRNAWTDDNETPTVDINMEKARDIHLNRLREIRAKKFDELGFPKRLHPSIEDAIVDVETKEKLQALRDFTKNIDLSVAETPEELKAIMPEELS
jgi:hypothetical protein